MKITTRMLAWICTILSVLVLTPILSAAEAASTAGANPIVELLTPVVALAVTFLAKAIARLPGWALPLVAGLAGGGYDAIVQVSAGGSPNLLQGVLFGLAATGLHQLKAQVQKPKPIPGD